MLKRLVHSHFRAHPRMNAALEFDCLTRWKNWTARSWTLFFFSRLYEDIRRAVRLWLEHRAWNEYHACRALWSRHRVAGKDVQWNDEATAEFVHFSERVSLAARVSKVEFLTNRHSRLTGSEHPKERIMMLRDLCNEFIERRFSVAGTGAWKG